MPENLKHQKNINGTALIDLGLNGSMSFDEISVYTNKSDDKDLIIYIVDKNNSNNKIQLTLTKPPETISNDKETEEPK